MRKKITKLLALTLAFTSLGFVSSCKDTEEDDIAQLRNDFAQQLAGLQKDCDCAKVDFTQGLINSLQDETFKETLLSYLAQDPRFKGDPGDDGNDGNDGNDGTTPTIGDNGNW